MDVMSIVQQNKEYLCDLRHEFHMYPETAWNEVWTSKRIREELTKLGIPYVEVANTATVATLEGKKKKPVIGLRCDIDALPVQEVKNPPYKSRNDGVMHACGHDSHITMLLGAAKILSQHKDELDCTVKFIFQPSEEVFEGAKAILDTGVLDDVDNFFGMHIFPYLPVGTISVDAGPRYTSADTMKIKIIGKSGHGAMPQFAVDPIYVGCQVVNALQSIASRELDPMDTTVVSVCEFHCGTRCNVIERVAELTGTVRTFSPEDRKNLPVIIERIISNTCSAFRAEYEFEYIPGPPAVINDPVCSQWAEEGVRKILGDEGVIHYRGISGGEDFALMLDRAPGVYAFVGCRNEANDQCYSLHHERFDLDENGMFNGCALYVQYVLEAQKHLQEK